MLLHASPLLKEACVRQVVLDKWFSLINAWVSGDTAGHNRESVRLVWHGMALRSTASHRVASDFGQRPNRPIGMDAERISGAAFAGTGTQPSQSANS